LVAAGQPWQFGANRDQPTRRAVSGLINSFGLIRLDKAGRVNLAGFK